MICSCCEKNFTPERERQRVCNACRDKHIKANVKAEFDRNHWQYKTLVKIKKRRCLNCDGWFNSEGSHNRICHICKR